MSRPLYIIGNWKMHKTAKQAVDFIEKVKPSLSSSFKKVGLSVPFTAISASVHASYGSSLIIGAQNMHDGKEGAFTGEISASMLKESGASFVLLGHSERRRLFGESSFFISRKAKRACKEGLLAVICVGESQEERAQLQTEQVLRTQLQESLSEIKDSDLPHVLVAYEPVWAIGTGHAASAEVAQETHCLIRNIIAQYYSQKAADALCLLYGGSVSPFNVKELIDQPDIDGVLVGGASLDPEVFSRIINH